jgi:hypothetical protein
VVVADYGGTAADGAGLAAAVRQPRQVGDDPWWPAESWRPAER